MSRRPSLRRQLLAGILIPVGLFLAINTFVLYRQARAAADTAYDRTLLATAKSIGELLQLAGDGKGAQLRADVPYSALEAFEADNRSRMYFRILGFSGETVSGFEDMPPPRRDLPEQGVYAALVHFYDDRFRGDDVRMAVLLQPVAGVANQGIATVQVAETMELRDTLARQLLLDTLSRQAALLLLIAAVVVVVVQRATRPVRELSDRIQIRPEGDLTPIDAGLAPREVMPLIQATNQVMQRLQRLLEHQQRFVRDASHQLRTPLAVLKTQVQSARRGDVDAAQALAEINHTVDRATDLANQMLALAKVEQLRQQGDAPVVDWEPVVQAVALDLAPLMTELDFSIETTAAPVRAHEWALRELVRNLLHNAIHHSPPGGALPIRLVVDGRHAALTIADVGPGIGDAQRERLFQPFASGPGVGRRYSGSGLGLAICREIVDSLGGTLSMDNRVAQGRVAGLDAIVRLALAPAGTTIDLR